MSSRFVAIDEGPTSLWTVPWSSWAVIPIVTPGSSLREFRGIVLHGPCE